MDHIVVCTGIGKSVYVLTSDLQKLVRYTRVQMHSHAQGNLDVGLFTVDDEGFIKVYEEEEPEENEMDEYADSDGRIRPKIVLISYNEEYPPRYISPNTRFEIVGKVVG